MNFFKISNRLIRIPSENLITNMTSNRLYTQCLNLPLNDSVPAKKIFDIRSTNRLLKSHSFPRSVSRFSLTTTKQNFGSDAEILRLSEINELHIVQKPIEHEAALDASMTQYAYDIKDGKGASIYTASHIHGPRDPFFEMKVFGVDGEPFIQKKLFQTVPSGLLHLQVYDTKGSILGIVQEKMNDNGARYFELKNPAEESICIVSGTPKGRLLKRYHKILSPDGHREIGRISKKWTSSLWSGDDLKMFIDVPQHLNPYMKALLIGVPIILVTHCIIQIIILWYVIKAYEMYLYWVSDIQNEHLHLQS